MRECSYSTLIHTKTVHWSIELNPLLKTAHTHRPVTYIAWRIFVFHSNRTTTHIIMMVMPVTIPIMKTDRQVIYYQIPSTHVLGEEFNCITLKYRYCPVSIICTCSSMKAKLEMDCNACFRQNSIPSRTTHNTSHYILLNLNTYFIIRWELDTKFLIVLFSSNIISKFRNITGLFTCKVRMLVSEGHKGRNIYMFLFI